MKTKQFYSTLLTAIMMAAATQFSHAAKLPLQAGDMAPLVKGKDQDGNKWKLADDRGKNIVLLYFYPKDSTPGCTKEACSLRDKITDLKKDGVKVIGVSFDSADSHKKFIFKYDLNFPLIADTDGKIADAYGARMGKDKKMARRISFLIGYDGKIVHVTDSPNPDVHLDEMQTAVRKLNAKSPL